MVFPGEDFDGIYGLDLSRRIKLLAVAAGILPNLVPALLMLLWLLLLWLSSPLLLPMSLLTLSFSILLHFIPGLRDVLVDISLRLRLPFVAVPHHPLPNVVDPDGLAEVGLVTGQVPGEGEMAGITRTESV